MPKNTFQYILCYGSTKPSDTIVSVLIDFNTSYVTVQLIDYPDIFIKNEFQYILCYGSTGHIQEDKCKFIIFQYILCYGSTFWLLELELSYRNFNTSYVTVQLKSRLEEKRA